ncbi:MAG: PKD domain-containing protein, partial [Cytophagaceae bacterium]
GNYTVVVTNANDCSTTSPATSVTVTPLPSAPTASGVSYCEGVTASPLTATGSELRWYTQASGGTALASAPTPSTASAGNTSYYVSQTVNGCESPRTEQVVTIHANPTATITAGGPITFCQGSNVVLSANTGANLSYIWRRGTTQVGTNATYTASQTGNYTVTVTNVNNCSSTSSTISVTVNPTPSAPGTMTVTYCSGDNAAPLEAIGVNLRWFTAESGGVELSEVPTPSTSILGNTSYYVSQTVNGCESARAHQLVTIHANPVATITAGGPTTFCQGSNVVLSANTGANLSYVWRRGTTQVGTNATYTASQSGNYTVTITNVNNCSTVSSTTSVTVNTIPGAPSASGVEYCLGATANPLTATGSGLRWYTQASGGTALSSAPTPSTVSVGTTSYYVSQTINGCESPRAEQLVTIHANPAATISAGGPTTFCQGGNVVLSANTGTNLSYVWRRGSTQVGTNATYTASQTGNYTVTVTNANNCSTSSSATSVTVNAIPAALSAPDANYCQGAESSPLTATGSGLRWYTQPSGGAALSSAPTPSTATVGTTSYYVSQTVNGCESPRAEQLVTIHANPTATISVGEPSTFCQGGSVVLSANTGANLSYVWRRGATQVGTGATYTAIETGNYSVTVSQNECLNISETVNVQVEPLPTTSNAGSDQYVTSATATLAGNIPEMGSGQWEVLGGSAEINSPTSHNSVVSNLQEGANRFRWIISNGSCPASSSEVTIYYSNSPGSQTISGSEHIAIGSTGIVYSIPDNQGSNYVWNVTGGASIISGQGTSSVVIDFGETPGSVSINVEESNAFGNAVSSINITTGEIPAVPVVSGSLYVPTGSAGVVYSVGDNTQSEYVWNVSEGASIVSGQGTNSIVVDFGNDPETISVSVVESNLFGSSTASLSVSSGHTPVERVVSGPVNVVTGASGVVYSVPDNEGSSYVWNVSGGASIVSGQGTSNVVIDFGNEPESVVISVEESNHFGSSVSTTHVSSGAAQADYSVEGPVNVATGSTGIVYTVPDNQGSTYEWSVSGGASIISGQGTNSIIVDFGDNPGTVGISVAETNETETVVASVQVASGHIPDVSSINGPSGVELGNTYTFTVPEDADPTATYEWSIPEGAVITEGEGTNSVTIHFPEGTVSGEVSVNVSNQFGSAQVSHPVSIITSLNPSIHISHSLFPNPFFEVFNLNVVTPVTEIMKLKVIDVKGNVVFESDSLSTNQDIILGSEFPQGLYIVQVILENIVLTKKVLKLK